MYSLDRVKMKAAGKSGLRPKEPALRSPFEYKSKTRSATGRRLRHSVGRGYMNRATSMALGKQKQKQKSASMIAADPRWQKVVGRDARADGSFWYGVATTGVYCKPSCSSRRANPQNVTFFDNPDHARKAGYRACKRCRPDGPGAEAEHA